MPLLLDVNNNDKPDHIYRNKAHLPQRMVKVSMARRFPVENLKSRNVGSTINDLQ